MHIYFSGIGGTGISSLALIAARAGYQVSGSDARPSQYLEYLKKHGVDNTHIGVDGDFIAAVHAKNPIDWFVYGSAQPMDFPDHPEFAFCQQNGIKQTKRDELLNQIIKDKDLMLIAIAGTHGKTTTTAMAVWVFKQLGLPVSYSGGSKLSFGDMAEFDAGSEYFIYEADEFDRNFLNFYPELSLITGIDWDHPDIYPTREVYEGAFREFLEQSERAVLWQEDAEKLGLEADSKYLVLDPHDSGLDQMKLPGLVNRLDAWLVAQSLQNATGKSLEQLISVLNDFPGVARRFELIAPNIYSDYAHTPPKIRGALQLAKESLLSRTRLVRSDAPQGADEQRTEPYMKYGEGVAETATRRSAESGSETADSDGRQADAAHKPGLVVVYEGLHNLRQHFIKDELKNLFDDVKELYVVPSYLARENPDLELLTPDKLLNMLSNKSQEHSHAAGLDDALKAAVARHAANGDLVLCLSAGGAGSLDEWLRQEFAK